MDSCHIFNFLFGTRKATSEFTKCFSSTLSSVASPKRGQPAATRNQSTIVSTCDSGGSNVSTISCEQSQHQSPLRQIQHKLANLNLAAKFRAQETTSNRSPQGFRDEQADCPQASEPSGTCGPATIVDNPIPEEPEHDWPTAGDDQAPVLSSKLINTTEDRLATSLVENPQFQLEEENDHRPTRAVSLNLVDGKVRAELCRVDCEGQVAEERAPAEQTISEISRQLFKDMKSERVRHLVQSFELNSSSLYKTDDHFCDPSEQNSATDKADNDWSTDLNNNSSSTNNNNNLVLTQDDLRTAFKSGAPRVQASPQQHQISAILSQHQRAKPPKTPPKSVRAKCFNWQLTNLRKPARVDQLFQDENFLGRLFDHLEPLDRCAAAQVCRNWRKILYSKQSYWKELVNVIDCTQLRREQLVECIVNTLHQSARLRQQQKQQQQLQVQSVHDHRDTTCGSGGVVVGRQPAVPPTIDQDEVWRIQELCNRYSRGCCSSANQSLNLIRSLNNSELAQHQPDAHQQQQAAPLTTTTTTTTVGCPQINSGASKSCSIPSQISSSTLSSISISSLLSPLSESSRVDSLREKLYTSIDDRGFDAICLFGATDEDIEDLARKTPPGTHRRILTARLSNCCLSDRGLELFLSTFNQLEELELSGCNEISNSIDLRQLVNLDKLIITDCTNIADGLAQKLVPVFHQLSDLTLQSYHLTDSFLEYVSLNADTNKLKRLALPNCKEITNQSMLIVAKHFRNVDSLSISGSTKINDDGIEILTEQAKQLRCLDLSWCTKITDASLECIACDLTTSLTGLILDRNVHISDIGLGYLSTMTNLELVYIRWCSRVTDLGLESLLTLRTLKYLSLAGLNQITARSLLCLIEAQSLLELELTNCCAANGDLLRFLEDKMPNCRISF